MCGGGSNWDPVFNHRRSPMQHFNTQRHKVERKTDNSNTSIMTYEVNNSSNCLERFWNISVMLGLSTIMFMDLGNYIC